MKRLIEEVPPQIRVAILDDHQSIIDGYVYRLSMAPEIQIVATAVYGEDLDPMMANHAVDVLLLDISIPFSSDDNSPFPVLNVIPHLLQRFPELHILVISMFTQRSLVEALMNAGINGYIYKDDQASIQQLGKIVATVASGGIYFSQGAYRSSQGEASKPVFTPRQLEAISLCAANPDIETNVLANQLGISGSTLRNLLSSAYLRLGVRNRAAAIAKAHQLGILPGSPEVNAGVKKKPSES
ncbi:MAG: response regulator transcription factor [Chloroflexota bacterium]